MKRGPILPALAAALFSAPLVAGTAGGKITFSGYIYNGYRMEIEGHGAKLSGHCTKARPHGPCVFLLKGDPPPGRGLGIRASVFKKKLLVEIAVVHEGARRPVPESCWFIDIPVPVKRLDVCGYHVRVLDD